jgi:hypothetical protein
VKLAAQSHGSKTQRVMMPGTENVQKSTAMCCRFAWGSLSKKEMMKAIGKNIKYLLFSSALFISIWISSFLVIPVTESR